MTILFYFLYVNLTPARWSWFWFLIAVLMQFVGLWFRAYKDYFESTLRELQNDDNYRGPRAL